MTDQPQHKAGFYPDPNDETVERYWDGSKWTDSRQPIKRGPAAGEKEQEASGTVVAGYIFAVLMPLIGFIIGLTQINRSRHGIWVVIVSIVAFFVWLAIIANGASSSSSSYSYY